MFATSLLGFTITTIWTVMFLVVWIVVAFFPANIARSKGRNFWLFFLLSIPFWWITLFWTLFMKDNSSHSKAAAAPSEKE